MCYVHNQWYDILCATLYYYTREFLVVSALLHDIQPYVIVFEM